MQALKALLRAFLRGDGSYEALSAHVETLLTAAPGRHAEVRRLLEAARQAGLPPHVHAALNGQVGVLASPPPASRKAFADTIVLPRPAPAAAPPTRDGFPDTVVLPRMAAPEEILRVGGRLAERYELVSKLGSGGMGKVWMGKDLERAKSGDPYPYVAIKLLRDELQGDADTFAALQREARAQQGLDHRNIARVHELVRDEAAGGAFITMEYLDGRPLDLVVGELPDGGLPVAQAMGLVAQLCAGLAHAHERGVVHSDLKPGNCFVTRDGTVKLLDFGVARAVDAAKAPAGDAGQAAALTPAYATAEMFEGKAPDPRDDVYALAVITYQLLTARHPYDRTSALEARTEGLVPRPVDKLDGRRNRGLARGLALSREARSPSVQAFLADVSRRKFRLGPLIFGGGVH